jgi:hypothetical protein
VHPVHRYQQDVIDRFAVTVVVLVIAVSGYCRGRQQNAGNGGTEHRGGAPKFLARGR